MNKEDVLETIKTAKKENSTFLDLSGNELSEIPPEIGELTDLEEINLGRNKLSGLPKEIGSLTNLVKLNIGQNVLTFLQVPKEIGNLTNLAELNLGNNRLSSLPPQIGNLKNLKKLDLGNNRIFNLPLEIENLTNLIELNLDRNELMHLPPEIGKLMNLLQLCVGNNRLNRLPHEIIWLKNLTRLDVNGNKLETLPPEIGELKNLTQLDVNGNELETLPSEIEQLKKLTRLCVNGNKLNTLPSEIGQLNNLIQMDVSRNKLQTLPREIGRLTKLIQLDINGNEIETLPPEIGRLRSLAHLEAGNNKILGLPPEIGQLKNLIQININNNKLSTLPQEIGQVDNLKHLHIANNQLSELAQEIIQLKKLKILSLEGNPLKMPPKKVVPKGLPAIKDYLRQLMDNETDYFYEAKILIVGEGGAGKTTLAKKIKNKNYRLQDEKSTEAFDVMEWGVPIEDDKWIRVNIWDFGGQEIYKATHQFFLTKRSIYILVADNRKEDTNFHYWLNIVELLGGDSPLLIVKNEKHNRNWEINERMLRGRYKNLKEILTANFAKEGWIYDIEKYIKHYVRSLPHIGTQRPKTWLRLREKLGANTRDYISLKDYFDICDKNGVRRPEEKLQLSGFLHDLGVCLHFQEDPLLKNTIILNPKWGTEAVYEVLDNAEYKKNHGKFSKSDFNAIWYKGKYAKMQDELLQLMINFKICFKIPSKRNQYLIPQLFEDSQPEYDWPEENNLFLHYNYEFMPKGIISRFIVILHYMIADERVWKSGVVLKKEETQAEVIEYYDKRELKIRVAGKNKRDMLTRVMHELEKIHNSFHNLKYDKMIPCNCDVCKRSTEPNSYKFDHLKSFLNKNIRQIPCVKSGKSVNVMSLIDDFRGTETNIAHEEYEFVRARINISAAKRNEDIEKRIEITNLNLGRDAESKKLDELFQAAFKLEKENAPEKAIKRYEDIIDENGYYLKAWQGLERIYKDQVKNTDKHDKAEKEIKRISDIIEFEDNVSSQIRLEQINIKNLPFFDNLSLEFQPRINILLGKNGFGKTHLFRLIVSLLQKDDTISSVFFRDEKKQSEIELLLDKGGEEKTIHRNKTGFESFGRIPVLAIPDLRFVEKATGRVNLIEDEDSIRETGAYHFLYQEPFENNIKMFLSYICLEYLKEGKSFDKFIFRFIHGIMREITDSAFRFHKISEAGATQFRIEVITEGNEQYPLPIQKASQGTLSLISIFGLIYYYLKSLYPDVPEEELNKKHALVFIDELDAHLHPYWQQKIVGLLHRNFPNIQFFITSHSPLLVAGRRRYEVSVLKKTKDGFTIKQHGRDFIGYEAAELYRIIFEIEDKDEAFLRYLAMSPFLEEIKTEIQNLKETELTIAEESKLEELYDYIRGIKSAVKKSDERINKEFFDSEDKRMKKENQMLKRMLQTKSEGGKT